MPFFACYLLKSESSPTRSYIGFTVDPRRRLRQHNGDLEAGARRTKAHRPWQMLCFVHGFTSHVQALQFEWAWQHPLGVRVLRDAAVKECAFLRKRDFGARALNTTAENNFELLQVMLKSLPWSRMPLTVALLTENLEISSTLKSARFASLADFELPESSAEIKFGSCVFCAEAFIPEKTRIVVCATCRSPAHVKCAASSCAKPGILIPDKAECAVCGEGRPWAEFAATGMVYTEARVPEIADLEISSPSSGEDSDVPKCALMKRVMQRLLEEKYLHLLFFTCS